MIKVKQKQVGKRLDVFLLKHLEQLGIDIFSRNYLANNWDNLVKVNGKYLKQSYKLKMGDEVSIDMEEIEKLKNDMKRSSEIVSQEGNLEILFEDSKFLIVEKQKGVVVHPGINNRKDTLSNYVKGYLEAKGEFDNAVTRAGIVHRLDKAVSGLMVLAKNVSVQQHLQEQFEKHKVKKLYLADVEYKELRRGIRKFFPQENLDIDEEILKLEESSFECDSSWFKAQGYVIRSPINRVRMQFKGYMGKSSKKALSYIKPISKEQVLIVIKTGRMHQIRVTLEYLGIGIKGDTLYGLSKSSSIPDEIALKSIYLGFKELNGDDFAIIKY
jgi:23S rRNA pseudouridine1911/1915/1917 synthase